MRRIAILLTALSIPAVAGAAEPVRTDVVVHARVAEASGKLISEGDLKGAYGEPIESASVSFLGDDLKAALANSEAAPTDETGAAYLGLTQEIVATRDGDRMRLSYDVDRSAISDTAGGARVIRGEIDRTVDLARGADGSWRHSDRLVVEGGKTYDVEYVVTDKTAM